MTYEVQHRGYPPYTADDEDEAVQAFLLAEPPGYEGEWIEVEEEVQVCRRPLR